MDNFDFKKLGRTIFLSYVAAVFVIMGGSQLTGYNLYTGDELQSHQAERMRDALGGDESSGSEPLDWAECMEDDDYTYEECEAEFERP